MELIIEKSNSRIKNCNNKELNNFNQDQYIIDVDKIDNRNQISIINQTIENDNEKNCDTY